WRNQGRTAAWKGGMSGNSGTNASSSVDGRRASAWREGVALQEAPDKGIEAWLFDVERSRHRRPHRNLNGDDDAVGRRLGNPAEPAQGHRPVTVGAGVLRAIDGAKDVAQHVFDVELGPLARGPRGLELFFDGNIAIPEDDLHAVSHWPAYRSFHAGARFSMNARTPSAASSVDMTSDKYSCSIRGSRRSTASCAWYRSAIAACRSAAAECGARCCANHASTAPSSCSRGAVNATRPARSQ